MIASAQIATVGQIDDLANEVAAAAEGLGLGLGARVGLCAANGPGFFAALLGLRRAGCVVALLDGSAPQADRLDQSQRFGCRSALTVTQPWPTDPGWLDWTAVEEAAAAELPDGAAFLKITSGTSGEPRAVVATAEALVADEQALWTTMGLRDSDRILGAIPMCHSYGMGSVVLPALLRGIPIVLPDPGHPFGALMAARAHDVTFLPTVPAFLHGLVRSRNLPPAPRSLRLVVSAGAPLSPDAATQFRRACGLPVHVFYGASECGGISFDREGGAAERGTLGTPVDGVSIELVRDDPELPAERGRVAVRSQAVASGYTPTPDPHLGQGQYLSNDIGAWDGPELRLHGRIDAVINVRGKKVDPAEVEAVLSRHDAVREAAVIGIPDIDGSGQVVRAIVAGERSALDLDRLRAWCRHRLAEHKLPRSLIVVDRLPRTDRGKVDRRALIGLSSGS